MPELVLDSSYLLLLGYFIRRSYLAVSELLLPFVYLLPKLRLATLNRMRIISSGIDIYVYDPLCRNIYAGARWNRKLRTRVLLTEFGFAQLDNLQLNEDSTGLRSVPGSSFWPFAGLVQTLNHPLAAPLC